jgi:uncharacterized protein YgbK (DUF1537 family)
VAGSSGIEYALTKHLNATRLLPHREQNVDPPRAVDRVIVISGSCSPVTERQIAWAIAHGFAEVPLDTASLLQSRQPDAAIAELVRRVASEFDAGRSVIVPTSRGPDDPRIAGTRQSAPPGLTAEPLGVILGRILHGVLHLCRVERVAVTGGDTSGYVARAVGIDALEMAGPLAPGAPLCLARSHDAAVEGVEITFKGGQVGHDDFFGTLVAGGESHQWVGGWK